MSLDRFSATYKPPKKEESKITKERLIEIERETKRKDKEFERDTLKSEFVKFIEAAHNYKQPMLEFPLVPWGKSMRYDIPKEKREEVINSLDCFKRESGTLYSGSYKDIHSGKIVKGSELEVIRENDKNWVVSPEYNESGGTLIDLMPLQNSKIKEK